ncbi:uncharacterized protein LOC142219989 [Haematobia irritans]|uniref:uncharacterized protein LOC142219989 n=1 Tax=Haematobia irritans TaxID=7368 RepID=UPI003F507FD3
MANISQLSDLRSYSRHWLGEFIEQYQTEECLWQPKHPDYSNNNVRNRAYDKLVEKLKEVEPNPDRNMVVRKINSLRSAFRREYRKMHSKQNYETRLWYYDKLSFIADQGLKRAITSLGGNNSSDAKQPKRSLTLAFEDDDSMEFEDEQQMEASSAHSASQTDLQQEQQNLATTITTAVNGEVVPVSIVKTENQHKMHHHQTQSQQQHVQHDQPPPLHHHHPQNHQIHTQTPQHTTAVKVLEITSLDSNSQREIQQAVNSLEQQHIQQQLQQHQQQQQANGAAAQLQIHQQVPTIQISREHLQPLFGSTTAYTTSNSGGGGPRNEDEFDAIGINVASKLRVMNTHQRIIAEKLISDVLFNGQLDNLSVNSHLSQ